ncbi:MAG TPA: gamma-glutamylcyclotransferase family protein [Acidobacteriota bacterium]|nr:gamma-glutamylcyclotransferase family protein [Acidobacteriota bacterium]
MKRVRESVVAAFGGAVVERLFVYGSLAPGQPNEHMLAAIQGVWEPAAVTGRLRPEGWGADLGYPGLDLDERGNEVEGLLFTSEDLSDHWAVLDEFEGEAYERVLAKVKLKDGRTVDAFVYTLSGR